jgi:hypothetical protein
MIERLVVAFALLRGVWWAACGKPRFTVTAMYTPPREFVPDISPHGYRDDWYDPGM